MTDTTPKPIYPGPYLLMRDDWGVLRFMPVKLDEDGKWLVLSKKELEERTK